MGDPSAASEAAETTSLGSYQDLVRMIRGHGSIPPARSVDALLDRLAVDSPGSLKTFALVYASRSLQSASREAPRVILFGPGYDLTTGATPPLVLAFPSDPTRPDFDSLEVMSRDEHANIHLAEARFPRDGSSAPVIEEEPPRCATCHGSPTRPIWDSYPVWPGAYGGNEDVIDDRIGELTSFRALSPKFGQPGRFRRLRLDMQPSGGGIAFATSDPNRDLQMSLSAFTVGRIAAQMTARPQFPALKYAVLGATAGCLDHGAEGWFSAAAGAAIGLTVDQVAAVTTRDVDDNHAAKVQRFFNAHGEAVPSGTAGQLRSIDGQQHAAGARFVSLLFGDDMRSWSMSLTPRAFSFATRGLENLFFTLYDQMKNDPVVARAVRYEGPIDPQVDCAQLAAASKAAITDSAAQAIGASVPAMVSDLASDGLDQQAPILRCMSCHTDPWLGKDGQPLPASTSPAPYFPFDQPKALGQLLAANGGALASKMTSAVTAAEGAPNRMPKSPRRPLSAAEQTAMTDFIAALAAEAAVAGH
jgi:hypothetical protein